MRPLISLTQKPYQSQRFQKSFEQRAAVYAFLLTYDVLKEDKRLWPHRTANHTSQQSTLVVCHEKRTCQSKTYHASDTALLPHGCLIGGCEPQLIHTSPPKRFPCIICNQELLCYPRMPKSLHQGIGKSESFSHTSLLPLSFYPYHACWSFVTLIAHRFHLPSSKRFILLRVGSPAEKNNTGHWGKSLENRTMDNI